MRSALKGRWTIFQIDAEYDAYGAARLVREHNQLCAEIERLQDLIYEEREYNAERGEGGEP